MAKLDKYLMEQYDTLPASEQAFADCFPKGAANAIPANELSKILGVPPRTITSRTKCILKKGYPICSGNSGYYIPASKLELWRYYVREKARNKTHRQQTLQPLKTILKMIENYG